MRIFSFSRPSFFPLELTLAIGCGDPLQKEALEMLFFETSPLPIPIPKGNKVIPTEDKQIGCTHPCPHPQGWQGSA